jgi:hypothetical protein
MHFCELALVEFPQAGAAPEVERFLIAPSLSQVTSNRQKATTIGNCDGYDQGEGERCSLLMPGDSN